MTAPPTVDPGAESCALCGGHPCHGSPTPGEWAAHTLSARHLAAVAEQDRLLRETDAAIAAHIAAAPPEEIAALERMVANHRAGLRGDGNPR